MFNCKSYHKTKWSVQSFIKMIILHIFNEQPKTSQARGNDLFSFVATGGCSLFLSPLLFKQAGPECYLYDYIFVITSEFLSMPPGFSCSRAPSRQAPREAHSPRFCLQSPFPACTGSATCRQPLCALRLIYTDGAREPRCVSAIIYVRKLVSYGPPRSRAISNNC